MARLNATSDQAPMPVAWSGVMFVEKIVPNGVGKGRPPARKAPASAVWQTLQSPRAATADPRSMLSGENAVGEGGAIA
jgi:hypothetical protein